MTRDNPPRKRFGQNFLHDPGVIQRILREVAPSASDHFIEIGPGRGAITQGLARHVRQLDVIEIDRDLASLLQAEPWAENITIHVADALEFDFSHIAQISSSLRLIGNLPYNISTPLLFHILNHAHLFRDIHVMLQKEVVDRITAKPHSRTYGRLTVALAARCQTEMLFTIGPGAFKPAPRVESAFARLTPLSESLLADSDQLLFDQILRAAFGQRRKQLANALSGIVSIDTIRTAGIDPKQRAEDLEVVEFLAIVAQHQKDIR